MTTDDLERSFREALSRGDMPAVEAALTALAVQDPRRAEALKEVANLAVQITNAMREQGVGGRRPRRHVQRRTSSDCPIPPCALSVNHPPPHVTRRGVLFLNEGTADEPVLRVLPRA